MDKAKEVLRKIGIGFIIMIAIAVMMNMCSSDPDKKEAKNTDKKTEEVKDYTSLTYKITKKDYPERYNQWGADWIDKINSSMLPAVTTVSKQKGCDEPTNIDLSKEQSKPREKAVYYVDCKNNERFYIDLDDAAIGKNIKSKRELDGQLEEEKSNIVNSR